MTARVLGVSAVAAAIAAAGVAGYFAGRPDAAPTQIARSTPAPGLTPASSASNPPPVAETEGVVAPVASAPAESASTRPVERERPASNRATTPTRSTSAVAATKPSPRATPTAVEPTPAPRTDTRPAPPATGPTRDEAARPAPVEPEPTAVEPARDARPIDERPAASVEPPPPPTPRIEEYVVPSDSVIGLQLDDTISTETARLEQRVDAHVARDVRVNGAIVIPSGTKARGQVTIVEPGGKFRERARLGVRFHTLVLADGTSVPIQTEAIFREGEQVGQRSAARIGGSAVGGAIIGAIFGGGKGAAIGAAAGAGAGTAATMATQKSQVTLHAGSTVTVRLTSPTTVSVEREN
jgi:hypothetical protein